MIIGNLFEKLLFPRASQPGKKLISDVYHDIYDFSCFPFSYGDAITWGVISSIRALKAKRKKVHVHLVCDIVSSGINIMTPHLENAAEFFMLELLPAFTSNPLFDGFTLHTSRESFDQYWAILSEQDDLAEAVYRDHLNIFAKRTDLNYALKSLRARCSTHEEINDFYTKTGNVPRVRSTSECLQEVANLKRDYPDNTFWVPFHCRLLKLDNRLKLERGENETFRDGNFGQWYNFIVQAGKEFPNVRFVLLGRTQEKPLALLRQPNVVAPRILGMGMGHEIAFIEKSNLFMGILSGPAQVAFFSSAPYAMIRCSKAACDNMGIPFGQSQVPFATESQHLYYGDETRELLMSILNKHLSHFGSSQSSNGVVSTTSRYFISPKVEERALFTALRPRIVSLFAKLYDGYNVDSDNNKQQAMIVEEIKAEVAVLEDTFPNDIQYLPDYVLLKDLLKCDISPNPDPLLNSSFHTNRLVNKLFKRILMPEIIREKNGLFPMPLVGTTGLRADGWCSQTTALQLGSCAPGSQIIFSWGGTAFSTTPLSVLIQIDHEESISDSFIDTEHKTVFVVTKVHNRLNIILTFAQSRLLSKQDPNPASANLYSVTIKPPR